jgi:pSer/pThr/pTyr-binding forkhead associated (FHA) protein
MKAELVPENGDPPIPINRDLMVVGRRDYCDIVINHSSLSKRHCLLVKTDGLLVIRDLISTNGTKVKGQKIRWAALLPDDRVTLGSYKVRVYLGPDDTPGPSELHRTRARGARPAASQPATGTPALEAGPSYAGFSSLPGFGAEPGTAGRGPKGFAEPSVEISGSSAEHRVTRQPSRGKGDPKPHIPIVLDDDDDIIELE